MAADLADSEPSSTRTLQDRFQTHEVLRTSNADALAIKEYEQAESAYQSCKFRTVRLKLAHDLLVKGPRDEKIAAAKEDWEQVFRGRPG